MLGRSSFRRSTRSKLLRASIFILTAVCLIDLFSILSSRPSQPEGAKSILDVRNQKVFIASIHWNNARILRSNWNRAVLDLVGFFGAQNVYISIYESGSWDESKDALRALDGGLGELGVQRTIILNETTHADEMRQPMAEGWIETPRGTKELRRIPYLSKLRNLSLKPLSELAVEGRKFDKVLFLNDVVFNVRFSYSAILYVSNILRRRTILPDSCLPETGIMRLPAPSTLQNRPSTTTRSP